MKIGRLRIGLTQCSDGKSYSLAAWEYVTGYWRWSLHWAPFDAFPRQAKWCGSWGNGRGNFAGWLTLPLLGELRFQTQPPMPSMKRWREAR